MAKAVAPSSGGFGSPRDAGRRRPRRCHLPSDRTNAAASALPRDVLLAFRLEDRDNGITHWWQLSFTRSGGVRFGLGEPSVPADVLFVCDYRDMIATSMASSGGRAAALPPHSTIGDASLMDTIAAAFGEARLAATVEVEFPMLSA